MTHKHAKPVAARPRGKGKRKDQNLICYCKINTAFEILFDKHLKDETMHELNLLRLFFTHGDFSRHKLPLQSFKIIGRELYRVTNVYNKTVFKQYIGFIFFDDPQHIPEDKDKYEAIFNVVQRAAAGLAKSRKIVNLI
uniref:Helitron_like_N domain-containing protein n=1 Tax=Rhabditophanes sp. KR3021 TaxID=114890 RepID=A0AC35UEJ2_9BILA